MMGKDLVKEAHSSGTVKVLVKMHSGGAKQVFNQFPAALTKYCAELRNTTSKRLSPSRRQDTRQE
jgi:hypothetical protein